MNSYEKKKIEASILWEKIRFYLITVSNNNSDWVQNEINKISYEIWVRQHEDQD